MRNARRWPKPSASVCTCARPPWTRRMLGSLRTTGAVTCLLAIFLSAGGHWVFLQSVAYTGMLLEFAQKESFCAAVQKTFDDRYACPLCPKIRDGYNQQRKAPPSTCGSDRLPEFIAQSGDLLIFVPITLSEMIVLQPQHTNFSTAPPTPPPRGFDSFKPTTLRVRHELRTIES